MDFETTTPMTLPANPTDENEEGARLLFVHSESGGESNGDAGTPSGAKTIPPGRTRRTRRLLLIATGGCLVGLLIYGAASRFEGERSTATSYKFSLPPAQSAAAVKALPPPNLLKPLSPQEASKENAERPFVSRPDTPAARFLLKTDTEDRTRALTCLSQAVYYEAAGEGVDGQRAVAQVVLNRVRHPGFPSTICGVVYEGADRATGCQFSFTCDGSMQRIPVPSLWNRSRKIAEEALKGRVFAPVGHATHYHADYVLPYWADSLDKSVQIGRHIFYRLRNSLGDARAFSQRYGGTEPSFREPGASVVIPQTEETQQLTNALISDSKQTGPASVEKALGTPGSALLVDSRQGTLLADTHELPKSEPPKRSPKCTSSSDRTQLSALKADDMRVSLDTPGC